MKNYKIVIIASLLFVFLEGKTQISSSVVPNDFDVASDTILVPNGKQLYDDIVEYNQTYDDLQLRFRGKYQLDSSFTIWPHPDDRTQLYNSTKSHYYYNEDFTELTQIGFRYNLDDGRYYADDHYSKITVNDSKKITSRSSHPWNGVDIPVPETEFFSIRILDYDSNGNLTRDSRYPSKNEFVDSDPKSYIEYSYNEEKLLMTFQLFLRDDPGSAHYITTQCTYHHSSDGLLSYILSYADFSTEVVYDSTALIYNTDDQLVREENHVYNNPTRYSIKEYTYNDEGLLSESSAYRSDRPELIDFEAFFYNSAGSIEKAEIGVIQNAIEFPLRLVEQIATYDYAEGRIEELSLTPDFIITARNDFDNHNHLLTEERNRKYRTNFFGELEFQEHDAGGAWFYSPVSPTSVNSLSSLDATLYPNPASSHLTLSLENSEMASLNIYDSRGDNVMTTVSTSGELIDITNLSSGLYFYEITQANKSMVGKFIKY